jgi:DNA polymerase-3 subunit epsilon
MNLRQVVLDTETTGLEAREGHRIIEVGCIEIVGRRVSDRRLHHYINPGRASDEGALAVHGLTEEFLGDKPAFEAIVDELLAFVAGAEVIIHNASFDCEFLDEELRRLGRPPFASHCAALTDSLKLAREIHPGKRNSLDALCDRYGVSNAHRTLHGALLDAGLLAEVYLAMTRGQDTLVIDLAQDRAEVEGGPLDCSALMVIEASADECEAHSRVVAALDKASGGRAVWTA